MAQEPEAQENVVPPDESLGSPEFSRLYEEHSRFIYYLALRMLGSPARAQDATHDVFLKAFRKMGQFRGESSVRTWLYRIALHHCQNLSQSWYQRHIFSNADENFMQTAPSGCESPLRILETKELGQRIQKTMDELPGEYRLLLLLVADGDLSYEEIASLTQQSADSVRGKLYRARKAFEVQFRKIA